MESVTVVVAMKRDTGLKSRNKGRKKRRLAGGKWLASLNLN